MFNLKHFAIAGIIALFVLYVPQAIAMDPPTSLSMDASYTNYLIDVAELCNTSQGTDYDKAKEIESSYWYNNLDDHWCNTNEMRNSLSGSSGDRSDDYHLCRILNSADTAPINILDKNLAAKALKISGDTLSAVRICAISRHGGKFTNKILNSNNTVIAGVVRQLAVSAKCVIASVEEERNYVYSGINNS